MYIDDMYFAYMYIYIMHIDDMYFARIYIYIYVKNYISIYIYIL